MSNLPNNNTSPEKVVIQVQLPPQVPNLASNSVAEVAQPEEIKTPSANNRGYKGITVDSVDDSQISEQAAARQDKHQ